MTEPGEVNQAGEAGSLTEIRAGGLYVLILPVGVGVAMLDVIGEAFSAADARCLVLEVEGEVAAVDVPARFASQDAFIAWALKEIWPRVAMAGSSSMKAMRIARAAGIPNPVLFFDIDFLPCSCLHTHIWQGVPCRVVERISNPRAKRGKYRCHGCMRTFEDE